MVISVRVPVAEPVQPQPRGQPGAARLLAGGGVRGGATAGGAGARRPLALRAGELPHRQASMQHPDAK